MAGGGHDLSAEQRVSRLTLVCQGATAATRLPAFATDDDALDVDAYADLPALLGRLGHRRLVLTAPSRAARETAAALATSVSVDPALRDCDFGAWSGRAIASLGGHDADALGRWFGDPAAAPPGGETLLDVLARLRHWLDDGVAVPANRTAVSSGYIVRATTVAALDLPPHAFWRFDAGPLSVTRLTALNGRWRLSCFAARA